MGGKKGKLKKTFNEKPTIFYILPILPILPILFLCSSPIYSGVSNDRTVWNTRTEQGIFPKIINTGQDLFWK